MSVQQEARRQIPAEVLELVVDRLRSLLSDQGQPVPADLGERTRLVGEQAVLTSLGLVSLIVELEQTIEERYGAEVTLADERALSQARSPFRTVASLADYICQLLGWTESSDG